MPRTDSSDSFSSNSSRSSIYSSSSSSKSRRFHRLSSSNSSRSSIYSSSSRPKSRRFQRLRRKHQRPNQQRQRQNKFQKNKVNTRYLLRQRTRSRSISLSRSRSPIKQRNNRNHHNKKFFFFSDDILKGEEEIILQQVININDEFAKQENKEAFNIIFTPFQKSVKMEKNFRQTILVALELNLEKKEKEKSDRPSIDLVCVVDTSGSMDGKKIQLVKDSLRYLMKVLGEHDRISIVTFSDKAKFLQPWRLNNSNNKDQFKKAIKNISAQGGTDIALGIQKGLFLIKNRKWKNQVVQMFLLSDGQDSKGFGGAELVQQELEKIQIKETFTINTFGFGNDHDAKLMNQIARFKLGTFQYVENIDKLADYFILSMSGMLAAQAKDISIRLEEIKHAQGYKIEKIFGENNFQFLRHVNQWETKMNYIMKQKKFLLEITIPKKYDHYNDLEQLEEVKRPFMIIFQTILQCTLEGQSIRNEEKIKKQIYLSLQLTEKEIKNQRVSEELSIFYLKCTAGDLIGQTQKLISNGENSKASLILGNFIEEIKNSEYFQNSKVMKILNNVQTIQKLCSEDVSNQQRWAFLIKKQRVYDDQLESCDDEEDWDEDQLNIMSKFKKGDMNLSRSASVSKSKSRSS